MSSAPFLPDRRLYPFRSRYFQATAGRIHYLDEGEGPAVLLLHGNPTWSFLYRGIVIRLRRRFRCIAVDYPGFGLSENPAGYGYTPAEHARAVSELVRQLDLRELTVVGQDWGGPVGLSVATTDPRRIRALVLGNTWYWPLDPTHLHDLPLWAFSRAMSTAIARRLVVKRNLFVDRILPLGMNHEVAPEVMDHYRGPLAVPERRIGVAEFPRQIVASEGWLRTLRRKVLGSLADKPVLLTWGMDDPAFRPALMDRFRDDFRDVRTVPLDARHYIQEDAPAEMAAAMEEFLDDVLDEVRPGQR